MTIQGKIQLTTGGNGVEQIQLIISQSLYKEFQEYKNINESDVVIDQEFCAGFTLSNKQLYVTGHFEQQGIMLGAENEEMGADSVSLQSQTVPIPINSVITQDNKQLDNVFAMAEELGLDDRNTETEELELFKHHEIQNEADEIKPATFSFSQPGFSYQSPYGTSFITPEKEDSNFSSVNSSMNSFFTSPRLNSAIKSLDKKHATLENSKEIISLGTRVADLLQQLKNKNAKFDRLKAGLEAKDEKIAQLYAKVEELEKKLAAKNTEVQQLKKEKKELEAKKQPTEQSKAPTYTAAAGFGLAAGLAAFIALERTVRLDIWVTVGIALASALAVSGVIYLALKPSTQVNEAETQGVNKVALEK